MKIATRDAQSTEKGNPSPYLLFTRPEGSIGCPIRASMGVLGHKWSMIVLRDVAFLPAPTFSIILHRNPGITPRVLSERLLELRAALLIEKVAHPTDERIFYYRLTQRGWDAVPILAAIMNFGMKHLPEKVFSDAQPKTMAEAFPGLADRFLGELYEYAISDYKTRNRSPGGLLLTRASAPETGVAVRISGTKTRRKTREPMHYVVRPAPSA